LLTLPFFLIPQSRRALTVSEGFATALPIYQKIKMSFENTFTETPMYTKIRKHIHWNNGNYPVWEITQYGKPIGRDTFKSHVSVSTTFHLPLALMAPRVAPVKPITGPPQALISRIEHLGDLLRNLPSSLPEKPSHSLYNFWTDPEILKDGGHFSAVTHALGVSFETHLLSLQGRTLVFTERGERLDTVVKFLKTGVKHMSPGERTTFQGAWLERLITAAVDSGAKIPSKKRKASAAASATHKNLPATKKSKPAAIIIIDDDSESENPHPISPTSLPPTSTTPSTSAQPSASKHTVVGNPKQVTLGAFGWKKAEPGEVSAYWAKAKVSGADRREEVLAVQKQKAEDQ
jgi:hypothetical protein